MQVAPFIQSYGCGSKELRDVELIHLWPWDSYSCFPVFSAAEFANAARNNSVQNGLARRQVPLLRVSTPDVLYGVHIHGRDGYLALGASQQIRARMLVNSFITTSQGTKSVKVAQLKAAPHAPRGLLSLVRCKVFQWFQSLLFWKWIECMRRPKYTKQIVALYKTLGSTKEELEKAKQSKWERELDIQKQRPRRIAEDGNWHAALGRAGTVQRIFSRHVGIEGNLAERKRVQLKLWKTAQASNSLVC